MNSIIAGSNEINTIVVRLAIDPSHNSPKLSMLENRRGEGYCWPD